MGATEVHWNDRLRRAQGDFLAALGFGPAECPYSIIASAPLWRLRDYGGGDAGKPPLLIVTAPIKRPYLWDLSSRASAVRYCLRHRLRVCLLEWIPPVPGAVNAGLEDYADQAIGEAVARISSEPGARNPVLVGHSLGGTFVAIFAALEARSLHGLVLLGAPLCFARSSSRFSDAVADRAPASLSETDLVPGSVLSEFCAVASPEIFMWSRLEDAARSFVDPAAMDMHMRIERWALDEVALSGRLVENILQWLYRENRLCLGTLPIRGRSAGPAGVDIPTLVVVTTGDDVASVASVAPFIAAMATRDVRLITYPGEVGVGLQHLGILAGREAYARVWPEIISWLEAHG